MKITVIGCGRWGSFIAWYLDRIGHAVTLYGRATSENMKRFLQTRANDYVTLSESIKLTDKLDCLEEAETVVISVNSQGLRALCREISKKLNKTVPVVLCMKGIEIETGCRLSEVCRQELGNDAKIAVWLGPGHVQEFTKGIPNCMVIDSEDAALKNRLVDKFSSKLIRFYIGTGIVGNEIGAAAKNVIGIAAGFLDGLALSTLKGALMSRGAREIARLIAVLGGNEISAYGLCHLGDYEATVFSKHSHNRQFGENFIKGEHFESLAEGYYTVRALVNMSEKTGVELPICRAVYDVLYNGKDANEAISILFRRSTKPEF